NLQLLPELNLSHLGVCIVYGTNSKNRWGGQRYYPPNESHYCPSNSKDHSVSSHTNLCHAQQIVEDPWQSIFLAQGHSLGRQSASAWYADHRARRQSRTAEIRDWCPAGRCRTHRNRAAA